MEEKTMMKKTAEERITSTYRDGVFREMLKIAEQIDFSHPSFRFKRKRNRSAGSVQALIVELAIQDATFRAKLRTYMRESGRDWKPAFIYLDCYH